MTKIVKIYVYFSIPPTSLEPEVQYEKMMEIFGSHGYLARTVPELQNSLKTALKARTKISMHIIYI